MRTIVSKFGGSSTAGAAQFRRILSIIRASPARRCIVLSAPGVGGGYGEKVTAMLDRCWRVRNDAQKRDAAAALVADRFRALGDALGLEGAGELARDELARALAVSRARTLSRGEYLCAALFSRFSGIPMVDAAELIAFREDGALDEARTQRSLSRLGEAGFPVVVPGFYGADPRGHIRVLPRNGSDITGALAAAGMGAGLYENWTDVPGLMTADPAVVPEARLIPQVSYRQMRALSRAGARVLHPSCLDPVALAGIPTRLRPTDSPDSFGTLIDEHVTGTAPCLAGTLDAGGVTASISAFGLPEARVREAARPLRPLAVEANGERVRLLIPGDALGDGLRALHRTLIE